jgi:hypothetical protein
MHNYNVFVGNEGMWMKWDWMILPGATFGLQLLFDLLAPLLLVLFFRRGRFYRNDLGLQDPSKPGWVRNLWI